jgi:3-hydroxyisobutyrate dehydrogenase
MGANMARRIKDCGFKLTVVHDAKKSAAAALAQELGCAAARSLAQATELADVIVTVVTDDSAMETLFPKEGAGLLAKAGGRLFINCATLSPRVHVEVGKRAAKFGAQAIEACMASSIPQARAGALYLMCAGEEAAFRRARPLLRKLSKSLRYLGPSGDAAKVKALVNMVMNANTAALAEGLALGEALGLDLTMLRKVFSQTGAASRVLQTDGEDMQNREHDCYFSAEHAAKDSGIALALARALRLELPLAAATKKQYDRMVELGLGQLDKSGIAELTFEHRRPARRRCR